MTIANNYAPVVVAANSSTTVFTGSWNAIAAANLQVFLENTSNGVQTPVTQGSGSTQYQVTTLTNTGFSITFNTAPATGNNVIIARSTPQSQNDSYSTSRGFQGTVEENSFDTLTAMIQENANILSRNISVPLGDTATLILPPAAQRAGFVLAFDASGNVIVSDQTLATIESAGTSAAAAAASATAAASSATASAASAAAAANDAAALTATSATSNTIGTGSKTFTTQSGKQFPVGQFILVSSTANSANYMHGQVTSYSGTTLVVNVLDIGGSGTLASWAINVSGSQGPQGNSAPSGSLIMHAANTAPTGYLECDGSAISRTTYAVLFGVVGTSWGSGDGSTTFNIPDFRGYFPRGWAHSGSVDSGRTFGSTQQDAMQGHIHNSTLLFCSTNSGNSLSIGNGRDLETMVTGDPLTDGTNGTPRTAAETRPVNVAVMFCIKT